MYKRQEEPSILARYLIDLSKAFSNFYNENKIIGEEKDLQDARIYLTECVGRVLKPVSYTHLNIKNENKSKF